MAFNNNLCVQYGHISVSKSIGAKSSTRNTITLPLSPKIIYNINFCSHNNFSSNSDIVSDTTKISVGGKNSNTDTKATYTGGYWMCVCGF